MAQPLHRPQSNPPRRFQGNAPRYDGPRQNSHVPLTDEYKNFIRRGYPAKSDFDLWKKLILDYPQSLGRSLSAGDEVCRGMKMTAVRNFFMYIRALEAKFVARHDFAQVAEGLCQVIKIANYQIKRKEPVITVNFVEFLTLNAEQAMKDPDAFLTFVKHFESVIAFYPRG